MADKLYDEFSKPVAIAYIGNKPQKKDTVGRTGTVWDGFGDVKAVDPRAAALLLKHKKVFIRAEELEDFKKSLEESVAKEPPDSDDGAGDDEKVSGGVSGEGAETGSGDEKSDDEAGDAEVDQAKIDQIIMAITSLDRNNKEHFFSKGSPKLGAVKALMPTDVEVTKEDLAVAVAQLGE